MQDPLLNYYVRGWMKMHEGQTNDQGALVPWSNDSPNPLFSFVHAGLDHPEHKKILEMEFAYGSCFCFSPYRASASAYVAYCHFSLYIFVLVELSLVSIMEGDYDRAQYFLRKSYEQCIYRWANTHSLLFSTRLDMLDRFQTVLFFFCAESNFCALFYSRGF
jgi:hypothetical protein